MAHSSARLYRLPVGGHLGSGFHNRPGGLADLTGLFVNAVWGIDYSHHAAAAGQGQALAPTQLYERQQASRAARNTGRFIADGTLRLHT